MLARLHARTLAACVLALASGCVSGPRTVVVGPALADERARVVDEQVELRCAGEGADQRCVLEADYRIDGSGSPLELEIVTSEVEQLELRDEAGALQPVERGPAVPALAHSGPGPTKTEWTRRAYRIDAGPGRRHLRVRAAFTPRPVERVRLLHTPALARHRVFAKLFELDACNYDRDGCEFWVTYVLAQPRAGAPAVRTSGTDAGITDPNDEQLPRRDLTLHGGRKIFAPGGPMFGLGLGLGFAGPDTAKLRAGWELFAPSYLAHAVAVELDSRRRASVALTSELMSPTLVVLPSLGVGVGLPIQVAPELLVGVRGQISLQLPYLGVVTTLDVFPEADEQLARPSLYLQFVL